MWEATRVELKQAVRFLSFGFSVSGSFSNIIGSIDVFEGNQDA